jgi:Ni/Co efflux regulator RcnB
MVENTGGRTGARRRKRLNARSKLPRHGEDIRMRETRGRIPDEIVKEIFPQKLTGFPFQDDVYAQLKKRILSGKLKKGQRLSYDVVAHEYNITRWAAQRVISELKKDGFIICKGKAGSIVR